jgi:hypothetical protein
MEAVWEGDLNWNDMNDGQRIITIMNGMRNSSVYIDIIQLFTNFPNTSNSMSYGIDLTSKIKIGNTPMVVYMNLAIYDDMRISTGYSYRQIGPLDTYTEGYHRTGYWDVYRFGAYRGEYIKYPIPILDIQVKSQYGDTFINYIYP